MDICRSGLSCRISNGATVEEHLEFWILVAGRELEWREYSDEVNNKVTLPGDDAKDCIGMHNNTVGTITEGTMFAAIEDKRSKSAVSRGTYFPERLFSPCQFTQNIKVLVHTKPSHLKSLCRRFIRKSMLRKRGNTENIVLQRLMDKTELKKYLSYRS